MGIKRASKQGDPLLSLQTTGKVSTTVTGKHSKRVWAVWLEDSLSQPAPSLLPLPRPIQVLLTHSPGVWHRAEGTPRNGGLKWGPRAIWGAFWGESRGGGCDISLQKSKNKFMLKTWRLPGSGRTNILPADELPSVPEAVPR